MGRFIVTLCPHDADGAAPGGVRRGGLSFDHRRSLVTKSVVTSGSGGRAVNRCMRDGHVEIIDAKPARAAGAHQHHRPRSAAAVSRLSPRHARGRDCGRVRAPAARESAVYFFTSATPLASEAAVCLRSSSVLRRATADARDAHTPGANIGPLATARDAAFHMQHTAAHLPGRALLSQ